MDVVVVGGGVVGLAIARAVAKRGKGATSVCVIEQLSSYGQGVSSRSSEVVHAGIYYPAKSLKAELCVRGRQMLAGYCMDRGIPFVNRGKLLVANNAKQQLSMLDEIQAKARTNGVLDLELLTEQQARRMEPALQCSGGALFSPSTSVIDSRALMASLECEASELGVSFAYHSRVVAWEKETQGDAGGFLVTVEHGKQTEVVRARQLVNCAGLGAVDLARLPAPPASSPAKYCKGNYFKTRTQKVPFSRLVYPLPEAHGLGVHLTIDVHGSARFGPDVQWTDELDYSVDASRAGEFERRVRDYWPGLKSGGELEPDYAAFRPKYAPDFEIVDHTSTSAGAVPRGVVHCLGIESPGLTSSLALAEHVADRLC